MNDILLPNTLMILAIWFFSFALFYYLIKTAVRNGVEQANARMLESVRRIEDDVRQIKTKKESGS